MDEKMARLIQAHQRAQRIMRLNFFGEAADYLIEKGCFSGGAILMDYIDEEVKKGAN